MLRTTVHMIFTRPPSQKGWTAKQWLRELGWLTENKLSKLGKLGGPELIVLI